MEITPKTQPDSPLNLAEVLIRGVVFNNLPVHEFRITFKTADGQTRAIKSCGPELSAQANDEAEAERRKLALAKRISSFIVSKGIRLSRKQIGKGMGFKSPQGNFGSTVAWMIRNGDLIEDEDGNLYTPTMNESFVESDEGS